MAPRSRRSKEPRPAALVNLKWEARVGYPGALVAGVDEVGRGCLAGPVVAAAVLLPAEMNLKADKWLHDVTDSKKLSASERERLSPLIQGWAAAWAIGVASVGEIDRINIYHASHLAMKRAVEKLERKPAHLLIDGNVVPKGISAPATAVVQGDFHCLSVGAASILAKVWRDQHMQELDASYPGYGFAKHKGYGTPAHLRALVELGCCGIHRRSFEPVARARRIGEGLPEHSSEPAQELLFALPDERGTLPTGDGA